jgi:hypothetical protein
VNAKVWQERIEDAQSWIGEQQVQFNWGNLGLSLDAVIRLHEEGTERP